ncbi:response regulator transcription factor [uncultured Flavonifractor sp.]|uniref:response regulator transcription factor n=1 Tax=uncultured Flavonifractor sp. TaxID=1193534 RepID=UPI0026311D3B|nr:response regulator transcription factor [uncultured Flavonifractor sp.]
MSTLLLVEDNPHIMKINAEALGMYGYEILKAATAAECRQALRWHPVDLVVLDIMLPDGNGVELCREIKEQYHIPILFLSALGESKDVVEGLRAGGDDYLSKPYDLEVLAARIEARLRQEGERSRYVCYGGLRLDVLSGSGCLNGQDLPLTQKEFALLLLLARNGGETVSKGTVLRQVWNADSEDDNRMLWTLISRLRRKLDSRNSRLEISSRRGDGYVLEQI